MFKLWRRQEPAETPRLHPPIAHWRDVVLPDLPTIPGMTCADEWRYFYWCCSEIHQPGRRAVELGPWVGCSTVALAAGLRRSDPTGKLVTIDCFTWDEWALSNVRDWTLNGLSVEQRARLSPEVLYPELGTTFLPIFHEYTKPLANSIHAIQADLSAYKWAGEPIDVLMIDAAKTWPAFDRIIQQFFPRLVDGAAVLHQDYKYPTCPWLHIVTERMIDRGVMLETEGIPGLSTQGFEFRKTHDFRPANYLASAFDQPEMDRLMLRSAERRQTPSDRLAVMGGYIRLLKAHSRHDDARRVFIEAIERGDYDDNYILEKVVSLNAEWIPLVARVLPERLVKQSAR